VSSDIATAKGNTAKTSINKGYHGGESPRDPNVNLTTEANSLPPAATTDILSKGEIMNQSNYILKFQLSLQSRFGRRTTYIGQDVDDIISYAVVTLMEKVAHVMVVYPDPAAYAGMRFSSVAHDFRRRQMAQRGEGARGERKWVSASDEQTWSQLEGIAYGAEYDVAEHMDNMRLSKKVMAILPIEQQRIVFLHGVRGLNVTEIAKVVGKSRETVSRALSAARRNANKTYGPAA
jgi:RNA polymerase sigma factor (sigma-70 family)